MWEAFWEKEQHVQDRNNRAQNYGTGYNLIWPTLDQCMVRDGTKVCRESFVMQDHCVGIKFTCYSPQREWEF